MLWFQPYAEETNKRDDDISQKLSLVLVIKKYKML